MIRIERGEFGELCAACGKDVDYELIFYGIEIRLCKRCTNELLETATKVCKDARREGNAERAARTCVNLLKYKKLEPDDRSRKNDGEWENEA